MLQLLHCAQSPRLSRPYSKPGTSFAMNNNNNNNNAAPIPVGFRFHPTDEELVGYYLHGKVGRTQRDQLIQELDLYKIEPWDLHELCRIGDDAAENQSDWYFFSHKDKKYPTGNRANRATAAGFWKATGRDKPIQTQRCRVMGMRKTLVFYRGRAPHGQKTDWIMHEFRLDSDTPGVSAPHYDSDGWVVCRVFRKTKNFRTKSQEDTSCSFEEDQPPPPPPPPLAPNHHLLSDSTHHFEFLSANPKAQHHHATTADASAISNYGPHQYNFTCKQEIRLDDYGTPIHQHHEPPCSFTTAMDRHLHVITGGTAHTVTGPAVTGQVPPGSSSLLRSCLQQASRPKLLQNVHGHELYSSVGPGLHGSNSTSFKDFNDDARSSSATVTGTQQRQQQQQEGSSSSFPHNEDWMLEGARGDDKNNNDNNNNNSRRQLQPGGQTLADVTCHIHIKRQTSSDRLFVSHENLVHLWNV